MNAAPSILLLDGGNTRIKYAWLSLDRADAEPNACASVAYSKLDLKLILQQRALKSIYFADVSMRIMPMLADLGYAGCCQQVFSADVILGVKNAYANPEKLGVDRFLSVIEAYHRYKSAVCVIDFGTAAKVDVVNADGQHQGGYIVPGLTMSRQSLLKQTAQVRFSGSLEIEALDYGVDTQESVFHGTLCLLVAWCTHVMADFYRQYPDGIVILTGGDKDLLASMLDPVKLGQIMHPNLIDSTKQHAYFYTVEHLVLSALARIAKQATE